MNSLFISMAMPFPSRRGDRMRNWAFLRVLAAMGEVTLVTFADPSENTLAFRNQIESVCRSVETIDLPLTKLGTVKDSLARVRNLFLRKPYGASLFHSHAMCACVQRLLKSNSYGFVICDEVFTLQNMPLDLAIPLILSKNHIATMILKRYVANERNPLKRAYTQIERWRTQSWETLMCSRATAIMSCSEVDRKILAAMCPGIPTMVVPNVVDVNSYTPAPDKGEPTILYQGTMDWYPNRDAVSFFASSILPLVRKAVPTARFVVAGHGAPIAFCRQFAPLGVEFTGTVADMRPFMAQAAVCVVPLRIAGGTRLKILEAAAMGKAIVSTCIGAEGLEFENEEEILLADSPEAFAEATILMLTNPMLRHSIGARARKRVAADYSLNALERALRNSLRLVNATIDFDAKRHSSPRTRPVTSDPRVYQNTGQLIDQSRAGSQ